MTVKPPVEVELNVTVHDSAAPPSEVEHPSEVNVPPVPLELKLTPGGACGPVICVTIAVHDDVCAVAIVDGEQLTLVEVAGSGVVTRTFVLASLDPSVVSPGYSAEIV